MKKRLLFLGISLLCFGLLLFIWLTTAPRRYVAQVQALEWSAQWDGTLTVDRMNQPVVRLQITDSEQQQRLFEALKHLRYEGMYQGSIYFHGDQEGYQVQLHGTEAGRVSVLLLAEPAAYYDKRPRFCLQYEQTHIVVSGAEQLLETVRELMP